MSESLSLVASSTSVNLGDIPVGSGTSASITLVNKSQVPVNVTQLNVIGQSFSVAGQKSLPVSIAAGSTYSVTINFTPAAPGPASGQLSIASDAAKNGSTTISLNGSGKSLAQTPVPAELSSISCVSVSFTGPGKDVCTVTLNPAAPIGGVLVNLSSSNPAVVVPTTVWVPMNGTSGQFTANVSPVLTAQAVEVTASEAGASISFALQLNAYVPTLKISSASLAFGTVALNSASTQSLILSSVGTAPVVIGALSLAGSGFSVAGAGFPLTINPARTTTLSVQFNPAVAGAATGQLTFSSNSSTSGTAVVALSGSGKAQGEPNIPGALSSISCASVSYTGSGKDVCTVTLNPVAPIGGVLVTLSSNNPAVVVPTTVWVPMNGISGQFTANVSPVLTAQAVELTASGGGVSMSFALQLNAYVPTLQISSASLAFGTVALKTPSTLSLILSSVGNAPVVINELSLTGSGFSVSGAVFPLTVNPARTTTLSVQFNPAAAGAAAGQLTFFSNSFPNGTAVVALSGSGKAPVETPNPGALSTIFCGSVSFTGSGKDVCTVTLNPAAPIGGVLVSLSSSNPAVVVPTTVSVPMNGTSGQFTASVSPVLTSQAVEVTASEGAESINFALQLNAYVPTLQISSASLAFGTVALNSPSTQSLILSSMGTAPVVIGALSLTGSGFSVSGAVFPLTLNPARTATLSVQFNPASAGTAAGQLTLSSNSSANGTAVIPLSGSGKAPIETPIPGALSSISCASVSFTGSGKDVCTVTVDPAAPIGGVLVNLSSSNPAVAVPATVWVPMNGTSGQFTANVSPVLITQAVGLIASEGGASMSFALQLNAYVPTLQISTASLAFGTVALNSTSTQSLILSSVGTAPVVIGALSLTGSGFSVSGAVLPLTVNPGRTVTLSVQFNPASAGAAAGQVTFSSNSSTNGAPSVALSGTGKAVTSFPYSGSPLLNTLIPPNDDAPISGNFFGMTIQHLDSELFPAFPVSTFRFWDVAAWSTVELSSGQFFWTKMDSQLSIAKANGVSDFIYTFGSVPAWASTNPSEACIGGDGAGTCAPPDMTAFDDFATNLVQRYCGTIKYYETWNEPNGSSYWSGTNAQLLAVAQDLYRIAKDPANCGCANGVCAPNGGSNPNQILLPPISRISTSNLAWLDSYMATAGSQYPYADVAAFHGYEVASPEDIASQVPLLDQTLAKHGLSNIPVWNTEASWGSITSVGQQQASWLMRYHAVMATTGVSRFVWYAYDNCGWGTLWEATSCSNPQMPAGQLTDPGKAYSVIESWLSGARLSSCQQYANGLWACELRRAEDFDAWLLWSSTGTDISVPIPEAINLTVYKDWQNNVNTLSTELTVGLMPVLLENHNF